MKIESQPLKFSSISIILETPDDLQAMIQMMRFIIDRASTGTRMELGAIAIADSLTELMVGQGL